MNHFFPCLAFLSYLFGASELCIADKPQIEMNRNGHAVVVWQHMKGHDSSIQANVFVHNNWDVSKTLSTNCHAIDPQVVVNAHNDDISAVAVWIQIEKGIHSLYAAMLPSSIEGWTNAAQISSKHENVVSPHYHIQMNEAGHVMIVWSAVDEAGNHYIHASTSHIGYENAWTVPTYVSGP